MTVRFQRLLVLSLALVLPVLGLIAYFNVSSLHALAEDVPVTPPVEVPVTPPATPTPSPTPAPSNSNSNSNNNSSNSSTSSSSSSSSAPADNSCHATKPDGSVDLFQVTRKGSVAYLYFTPNAQATSYSVVFGFTEGDERYGGISMAQETANGVQMIRIDHLTVKKTYAFKVIPMNGCASGDWSNWLTSKGSGVNSINYRYAAKVSRFSSLIDKK